MEAAGPSQHHQGVVAMIDRLAAEGRTLIVVTHERDPIAATRTVMLADGRVVA